MIKKTLSLLLLAASLLCGCVNPDDFNSLKGDIDKIEQRIEYLETLCKETNTNISSLQTIVTALQASDYITAVTPINQGESIVGYTISFKAAAPITVYNGKDGSTPVVSVRVGTDGIYYWTLNGEWLLDGSGKKLAVTGSNGEDGVSPTLKIGEDGNWYVSYNNGATWDLIGAAVAAGGDSFFKNVTIGEDAISFVLADDTSFVMPRYVPVDISFNYVYNGETGISEGQSIVIPYTVTGTESENIVVTASSDGNYKVKVDQEAKNIEVTCPRPYIDGYINVMLYNGNGYAQVKVINFYERNISVSDGLEYLVSVTGEEIEVPISINFDYSIRISTSDGSTSWITQVPQTKAEMRNETLVFNIASNPNEYARSANVYIIPKNSTEAYTQITFNQASATLSIDKTRAVFAAEGGSVVSNIISTRGLLVSIPNDCTWLTYSCANEEPSYALTLTAATNLTVEPRSVEVGLFSSDGSKKLGAIEVTQAADGSDNPNAMIITVKPLFANDFVVYLPINSGSKVDCYVDWGDGSVERFKLDWDINKVFHRYDEPEAGTLYDVKITGYVPELYSTAGDVYYRSIIAVKQWGNLGTTSMSYAFKNNKDLVYIPEDDAGAFENVTNFNQSFYGCTGLSVIPDGLFEYAVNATEFKQVFFQCENLTTLPSKLFKNCAKAKSFQEAFKGCYSLTTLPAELFYNCSEVTDFKNVFSDCKSLTTIGNDLFKNCTKATNFNSVFSPCVALETVPESLFYTCSAATHFTDAFSGNTAMVSVPANLFRDAINVTTFQGLFSSCRNLNSVPEGLFGNSPNVTSFAHTFYRCSKLPSIPVSIFDNNRKVSNFESTFDDCSMISGESPYTIIDGIKYHVPERRLRPDSFTTPAKLGYYMYGTLFSDRYDY